MENMDVAVKKAQGIYPTPRLLTSRLVDMLMGEMAAHSPHLFGTEGKLDPSVQLADLSAGCGSFAFDGGLIDHRAYNGNSVLLRDNHEPAVKFALDRKYKALWEKQAVVRVEQGDSLGTESRTE